MSTGFDPWRAGWERGTFGGGGEDGARPREMRVFRGPVGARDEEDDDTRPREELVGFQRRAAERRRRGRWSELAALLRKGDCGRTAPRGKVGVVVVGSGRCVLAVVEKDVDGACAAGLVVVAWGAVGTK